MKYILLIIVSITFMGASMAQNQKQIEMLNAALKKGAAEYEESKVFIKTDKDSYAPGEKIWFKTEVINCFTQNSSSEKELIMMIKAESGEIILDNKYIIENGMVTSQIAIPTWTNEGKYFLIAYTPNALKGNKAILSAIHPIIVNTLKRNDYVLIASLDKQIYKPSDEVKLSIQLKPISPSGKKEKVIVSLYDCKNEITTLKKSIYTDIPNEIKFELPDKVNDGFFLDIQSDGKGNYSQKIPILTTKDQVKVEFYPEGGTLLTNNIQRIVYRASDALGEPVDITGSVYDPMNNQVGIGKIIKKGFGLISLMPMPNQQYTFKIESEYGKGQKFEMPQAVLDGSSFTLVKTENETLRVSVISTGNIEGEELTIAAIASGEVKLLFNAIAQKKQNFDIYTTDLPLGIINFVVLNSKREILSERLIYNIPNKDIDIEIGTKLTPTEKNGEVEIAIDLKNFIGFFGNGPVDLKIVDKQNLEHALNYQQHNFLKYPLLTPTPKTVLDIYLTNIELIANKNKFVALGSILSNSDSKTKETPNSITGRVTNKNGEPVANASVMAILNSQPTLGTAQTDINGRFTITGLAKCDNVVVKAMNDTGKKIYNVKLDRTFDETLDELLLNESLKWTSNSNTSEIIEYYNLNKELLKLIGTENKEYKTKETSTTEKMLMSGTPILDVVKMLKSFTLKDNQIVFYGSNNSLLNQEGALIVIDGQKMGTSISAFETINPHEVASINVSTNPVDIQEFTALNSVGVIKITTKGGKFTQKNTVDVSKQKTVNSFSQDNFNAAEWRYQTTLFWQPNIVVDENGIIRMKLKVSEIQSDFIVLVDITSENGITHQKSTTFSTIRNEN